ncbi:MAG: response regulator [Planctomycetota bacterium]
MSVRILLVDDHQLMRQGLRSILEDELGFELVGEASSGRDAVRMAAELQPTIVIMDVAMPGLNGIEATRQIKEHDPRVGVIALSSYSDRRYVLAILGAGADGYVLKAGAYDDLRRAVRAVSGGNRFLCPEVAGIVVDATLAGASTAAPAADDAAAGDFDEVDGAPAEVAAGVGSAFKLLGPREREVLQLVAEGFTSAEIAARLHVSPSTVDTHRRNLMRKVGLRNAADVTRYAIREGLVSPEQ